MRRRARRVPNAELLSCDRGLLTEHGSPQLDLAIAQPACEHADVCRGHRRVSRPRPPVSMKSTHA